MNRIFISYAREDAETAQMLYANLKCAGLNPWLDTKDLLPGQDWEAAIRRAIRESSHFLALISSRSITKRGFIQKELRQGFDILDEMPPGDIFIIPIRLEPVEPRHEKLAKLQWVDLFSGYDKALANLLFTLSMEKESKDTLLGLDAFDDGAKSNASSVNKRAIRISSKLTSILGLVAIALLISIIPSLKRNPPAYSLPDEAIKTLEAQANRLREVARKLGMLFANEIERGTISILIDNDSIRVTFQAQALFSAGTVQLTPEGLRLMSRFGQAIVDVREGLPDEISVEGHTDDLILRDSRYPGDNFEFTSARALAIIRALVDSGLDQSLFSAGSFAGNRPISSNDTSIGRARNRRVELLLFYREKES